ncbi:hypothetical protein M0805_005782 [Coniferiporia weirii]|nr:hypothetical protein M0805_005782 [Coniferiporia weirii]
MVHFNQSAISLAQDLLIQLGLENVAPVNHPECYKLAAACVAVLLVSAVQYVKYKRTSVRVPAAGSSGLFSSYFGAYEFIESAKSVLIEGYRKYKRGTFKVPGLQHWIVTINDPGNIEEVRKAPDDKFSFGEAISDTIAARWTIGTNIARNHYHQAIIRSQLTRSLGARFEDIKDELTSSFEELIPAKGNEWIAIPALQTVRQIVCRTSNRLLVGLPLCRNQDYVDLNISFTIDVSVTALRISKIPVLLRPIFGALITKTPQSIRRGLKHLGPVFDARRRELEEHGEDWADKPADMITWLLEDAPEDEKCSNTELTKRMLVINFAAIHTSSNTFTHALYYLALEREKYVGPLREEVERVLKEEGWTKVAMTAMRKLDSFMKESLRLNAVNMLVLNRKVLVDYTLPDGTFLPKGTFVAANAGATHFDDEIYENADVFDGFRFADIRDGVTEESTKHQMISTSPDYLAFGHGRHACPGRFFAVNELKAMMAYVLLMYGIKLETEGIRPANLWMGTRLSPNPAAKVLFRKRSTI